MNNFPLFGNNSDMFLKPFLFGSGSKESLPKEKASTSSLGLSFKFPSNDSSSVSTAASTVFGSPQSDLKDASQTRRPFVSISRRQKKIVQHSEEEQKASGAADGTTSSRDNGSRLTLHQAILDNNLEEVRKLAAQEALLKSVDTLGYTPIMVAALEGNIEAFEILKKAKAELGGKTKDGLNILHLAAKNGKTLMVKHLLVDHKDLLESKDVKQATPLLWAAYNGWVETYNALLLAGANQNAVIESGMNALHLAARMGKKDMVQFLLESQKDLLNKKDNEGRTPFLQAIVRGHEPVALLLLEAGADACSTNNLGENALHLIASYSRSLDFDFKDLIPKLLANYPALLEGDNLEGLTPILCAMKYKSIIVGEKLLKAGANLDHKTPGGRTYIDFGLEKIQKLESRGMVYQAAMDDCPEMVRAFSHMKEMLKWRDQEDRDCFYWAVFNGSTEISIILLTANVDPSSAVHLAAQLGRLEILKLILKEHKEKINSQDEDGNTPLHLAARHGHVEVVSALEMLGANVSLKNNLNFNPLHEACAAGNNEVVKQILAKHPDQIEGIFGSEGWFNMGETGTPLFLAAKNGRLETCRLLLKLGANSHAEGKLLNVLDFAIESGNIEVVRLFVFKKELLLGRNHLSKAIGKRSSDICLLLLSNGANPALKEYSKDQTCLHLAAKQCLPEVVEVICTQYAQLKDLKDREGNTALMLAARNQQGPSMANHADTLKTCQLLIKQGVKVNETNAMGQTALHLAVEARDNSLVELLCNSKELLEMNDKNGLTPLLLGLTEALKNLSYLETCVPLITAGANPFARTPGGLNAFHLVPGLGAADNEGRENAIFRTSPLDRMLGLLEQEQEKKAEVEQKERKEESAGNLSNHEGLKPSDESFSLHRAVIDRQVERVAELVKKVSSVDVRDQEGATALMWAALLGDKKIFANLTGEKADPRATNLAGLNAYHFAICSGKTEILEMLVNAQKHLLRTKDRYGNTGLMIAAGRGHLVAFQILLKAGADLSVTNNAGQHAIHLAGIYNRGRVLQSLAHRVELLDLRDNLQRTPLMLARDREACRLLLDAKATLELEDSERNNVLHLAIKAKDLDKIAFLLQFKKLLEMKNSHGQTPLHLAAWNKQAGICAKLLDAGANIDAVDNNGRNAFHYAVLSGDEATINLFLERKKELLHTQTKIGNSPVVLAAQKEFFEVFKILVKAGAAKEDIDRAVQYTESKNNYQFLDYITELRRKQEQDSKKDKE